MLVATLHAWVLPPLAAHTPLLVHASNTGSKPTMAEPPSPPPAIDLRRPAAQQAAAAAAEAAKYGFDPRDSVAEDVDLVPDAEFAISTGAVGSLGTVEQLQAALNAADDKQQVVVIKFMREGCTACASTVDKIKSVAKQYAGAGQFYEVNYDESKGFCRQAKVRFVPSAHIYAGNKLVDALHTSGQEPGSQDSSQEVAA